MTKDEFEAGYAERSGVTVEWLHEHSREGRPCDCGDESCQGWQMIYVCRKCGCDLHVLAEVGGCACEVQPEEVE